MDTAIILTSNLEAMADFYGQGLELGEAARTGPDHLGFAMPNAYLGFDRVDDPPSTSGVLSLWFRVDDLEGTFERFKELGAGVKYGPTTKPWGDTLAAMYDLDGNLFGLALRKPEK
jgi:catechol 2,3-dioxygenase-like lactoylglutathione lyase family enzyme